jgi:DNA adenine methylase
MKAIIDVIKESEAKPFLKWAGGKSQLLPVIDKNLPEDLKEGKIKRYIEPFVGSGAVLFHLLKNYELEEAIIWDINPELINVYKVIKDINGVKELVDLLAKIEKEYISGDKEERKKYYYDLRDTFNNNLEGFDFDSAKVEREHILRAAQFIFLNKTCFNGLFRVNKSGFFNVPMGDYKNPLICNKGNLLSVHRSLQRVKIENGDFRDCADYVNKDTFVYFDPPYKPLSQSSSFTSYSKFNFGDDEQKDLASFLKELNKIGAKLMLSNSDPEEEFFENMELYGDKNIFDVKRVSARRSINSKAGGRGEINELLITNYKVHEN